MKLGQVNNIENQWNQSSFFKKINKIGKSLGRVIRKKKIQITEIKNDSGGITTNLKYIIRINTFSAV
jgi:hypothetical protein